MNKRTRLGRRILREHRQGYEGHYTKISSGSLPGSRLMSWWTCTHCAHAYAYHPKWSVPRAYR